MEVTNAVKTLENRYFVKKVQPAHNFKTIAQERKTLINNYPEQYTKTHNGPKKERSEKKNFTTNYQVNKELFKITLDEGATLSCTRGYFSGKCSGGHKYLKAIFCGREWCQSCGEDGSPTHLRRMARWMPKVNSFKSMRYTVITIPAEIRHLFKTPAALTDFRTFVKRRLQRQGHNKGLIRWHYFGECQKCKGNGCKVCNNTGTGHNYNPHLNIFTEGSYLKGAAFKHFTEDWKNALSDYFYKVSKKRFPGNIHIQHATDAKHKMHRLKYVTRSTHRNFNQEIADNLKGYRTTSTWGKWPKAKTDTTGELLTELISIVNGFCPCCAEKITWNVGHYIDDPETGGKKFKRTLLKINNVRGRPGEQMVHMEAGYYMINEN